MLPDLDVLAFHFGIPYSSQFGHRGFSHSILLAGIVALLGMASLQRLEVPSKRAFCYLWISMASHGLLDTITTGGKGIALLWPFTDHRFFAPTQVIKVSPIGLSRFFSSRGLSVLASELLWVWLPATVFGTAVFLFCRARQPNPSLNSDPAGTGRLLKQFP
jgi:inner membrane protein